MFQLKNLAGLVKISRQPFKYKFSEKKSDEAVNYYQTLKISQDATFDEIKKKFK